MTLFRGIADDVPLQVWLEQHIWPREAPVRGPEFVYDGARLAAAEMLRGGVTCCNDMYFYPDATARAVLELGMRAMLGLPVLDFPTPYAADADGYLQQGLAIRDALKHEPLLAFSLVAARALHRGRRDLGEDRRLRAAARPADPDPSRGDGARGRAGPRTARAHAARTAACAGRHRARDSSPSTACTCRPTTLRCSPPRVATWCTAPSSNMKLGSGIAPVSALLAQRRERRARHRRRGVEQPPRSLRRNARRDAARQGGGGRSVGAAGPAGAARGDARRRPRAGPRPGHRLARRGQAGGRRRGRPVRDRRNALLRSGLASRPRRRPRGGDRRLGCRQASGRPTER